MRVDITRRMCYYNRAFKNFIVGGTRYEKL